MNKLSIVAGEGIMPKLMCNGARKENISYILVIAINGMCFDDIDQYCDDVVWCDIGDLENILESIKEKLVTKVIFAGRINPKILFNGFKPKNILKNILKNLNELNAQTIFSSIIDVIENHSIEVLNSALFLKDSLCPKGIVGSIDITDKAKKDYLLGYDIAKEISRLNIGQSVLVKNGIILCIEAFEGTNKAIDRAGELSKGDITLVKVAKKNHDIRYDIPCIGITTIKHLKRSGIKTLALESQKTLILDKNNFIEQCNQLGICIIGI